MSAGGCGALWCACCWHYWPCVAYSFGGLFLFFCVVACFGAAGNKEHFCSYVAPHLPPRFPLSPLKWLSWILAPCLFTFILFVLGRYSLITPAFFDAITTINTIALCACLKHDFSHIANTIQKATPFCAKNPEFPKNVRPEKISRYY